MLTLNVIVAMLAVARLTKLVTFDKITIKMRLAVTEKWGRDSWQTVFIHCEWCVSVWVALLVMPFVVLLSGGGLLLAALSVPAASYVTGFLVSKE